jgi:hypothetical protein
VATVTCGGPACRRPGEASDALGRQPLAEVSGPHAIAAATANAMTLLQQGVWRENAVTVRASGGTERRTFEEDRSPMQGVQKTAIFPHRGGFGRRKAVVGRQGDS